MIKFSGPCSEEQMDVWLSEVPSSWTLVSAGSCLIHGRYHFWAYVQSND